MILLPGTVHYVTWTKQNLLDTATYYPQAIIKDKKSDATLATLDLSSLGSDRYGANWNVVQDPTGMGREVSIVTTIYEDSGHTTVSGIYGAWETDYLIYELKPLGGGGGGGSSFDVNEIRKIIREEIAKIEKPVIPEAKTLDLSPIIARLEAIDSKEVEIDLEPLKNALNGLKEEVANIDKSRFNNQEIMNTLIKFFDKEKSSLSQKTDEEMTYIVSQFKKIFEKSAEDVGKKLTVDAQTILKEIKQITDQLSGPIPISLNLIRKRSEKTVGEKVADRASKLLPFMK